MKVILSPTKKMRSDPDSLPVQGLPCFLEDSRKILAYLMAQTPEQLQALWGCNDAIARQNVRRLQEMDLEHQTTPAILSYDGIAFQYMAPSVFEDGQFAWVQAHLRILSGFYGVLKPMDGVQPYRLEMQAPAPVDGKKDLYDFWGRRLYEAVRDDSGIILNLASREYSKCIEPYLTENDRFIRFTFAEEVGGRLRQKATFAKMARGEMVRYLAELNAQTPEQAQGFDRLGYRFRDDLSTDAEYIFQRIPEKN